jgi:hypothetical protein
VEVGHSGGVCFVEGLIEPELLTELLQHLTEDINQPGTNFAAINSKTKAPCADSQTMMQLLLPHFGSEC